MNYMFLNTKNKIFLFLAVLFFICTFADVKVMAQGNIDAYLEDDDSTTNYYRTETRSKKGIQEAYEYSSVYEDLGISHTLINVCLNKLLNGDIPHVYNGKTYYFSYIPDFEPDRATEFNNKGVSISAVLLMQMDYRAVEHNLIYTDALKDTSRRYYAWNVYDSAAMETMAALMDFLAHTYGRANCHIDNWIVGNEVNMPNAWNYTGTTNVSTNVDIAARSFYIVYKAIKRYNSGAKAYLSLDHSWTHNDEGRGIGGKTFLDAFGKRIEELYPGIEWNLAYHPYAPIMTQSNIWNSRNANYYTPNHENAAFISAKNLEVLTNHVKENFGEDVRIILSEQGFTAYNGQEAEQAAALAYTYYAAEFNDMIDATMFRSLKDAKEEVVDKFYFGLLDTNGGKRIAYNVFKYMDTEEWEEYTARCLATIGITDWTELLPAFKRSRFTPIPLEGIDICKSGTVIAVGYKETLEYEVYPEFATTKGLKWSSDDESVVKINETTGEMTAVAPGRAVVTAASGNVDYSRCVVVVKEAAECEENINTFITDLYLNVKGQEPSKNDLQSYRERLLNRNMNAVEAVYEVIFGTEAMTPSETSEDFVSMIYQALIGVEVPDAVLEKYSVCLEAGMAKEKVFVDLIESTKFDYRCYDYDIDTGKAVDVSALRMLDMESRNVDADITYEVAEAFYLVLERFPDIFELNSMCTKMLEGKITQNDIIRICYESTVFKKRNLTNEDFMSMLYNLAGISDVKDVINRLWIGLLNNEQVTRDEAFETFFEIRRAKAGEAQ